MSRISAAQNLTIEIENQRWRLISNGDDPERVLIEAAPGQPLRYIPLFASKRHLPEGGELSADRIQRVVLGWSANDASWHLGLMLDADLAAMRGSRWCEIAHWIDPQHNIYANVAAEAGQMLAESIARPFNLIPPRADESAAPAAASAFSAPTMVAPAPAYGATWSGRPASATVETPSAPPVQRELPPLPIRLDRWTLESGENGSLELKLDGSWTRSRLLRILWYALWAVVYVGLSILTLRGAIALPKPEFLPYLGLASAAVLILLVLYSIGQLFTHVNRIVFDRATQSVRGMHGRGERWHIDVPDLQGIYVSQVVSKRAKADKRTVHHSELNVQCADHFEFLVANLQSETKSGAFDDTPLEDAVMPLTPNLVYTDMQAAGAHVARVLDVPCWYDQHLR